MSPLERGLRRCALCWARLLPVAVLGNDNGSWVIKAKICESQIAQPDDCSVWVAVNH